MNVDLLKRTLAHIEAHPGEWNQAVWHCGTAACFAGHAAILAGGVWDISGSYFPDSTSWVVLPDGHSCPAPKFAQEQLDITVEQRGRLFDPYNTLDDLRSIVAEFCTDAEAQS